MNNTTSTNDITIGAKANFLRQHIIALVCMVALIGPTVYLWRITNYTEWYPIVMIVLWLLMLVFLIINQILRIMQIPIGGVIFATQQEMKLHFNFGRSKQLHIEDISHYTITDFFDKGAVLCDGIFIYTYLGGRYLLSDKYLTDHLPAKQFLENNGITNNGEEEYNETQFMKSSTDGIIWLLSKIPFLGK